MAKIMRKSRRFGNVGVETADRIYVSRLLSEEPLGNAPRDLRDFERMGETIVKNVALFGRYHLSNYCKPTKRP